MSRDRYDECLTQIVNVNPGLPDATSRRIVVVVAAALFALLWAGIVQAQSIPMPDECGVERQVSAGMLSEPAYNRLSRIYEDIGDEKYAEAYSALEALLGRTRNEYEQAVILQAMGFVRASQERYAEALEHFNRAIRLNRLPDPQHFDMILQVAQFHNILENHREALRTLDVWFCLVPETETTVPNIWVLKASIHSDLDEFREAVRAIDRAIELSDQPREDWYQLKLSMHFEMGELEQSADVLHILINMNPARKTYWIQLASILLQMEQEREAMSVFALAHRKDLLDRQSEYLQLSSLYQAHNFPRKAAEIIEDGIARGVVESTRRNWELAAGAWYDARELDRSLIAYERAGEQSVDGKIDLQRAFILVNQERWGEARDAARRALGKGGLNESEQGNANLLLGMAEVNLDNFDNAIQAFNEAAKYGRLQRAAQEWINHVREERSRRASL